jgi:MFS family permease
MEGPCLLEEIQTTLINFTRTETLAMVFVFSMVGTVLGPILGGLLTEKASWRWCKS